MTCVVMSGIPERGGRRLVLGVRGGIGMGSKGEALLTLHKAAMHLQRCQDRVGRFEQLLAILLIEMAMFDLVRGGTAFEAAVLCLTPSDVPVESAREASNEVSLLREEG